MRYLRTHNLAPKRYFSLLRLMFPIFDKNNSRPVMYNYHSVDYRQPSFVSYLWNITSGIYYYPVWVFGWHYWYIGKKSAVALNGFVYYFALPALLFGFTAQAPILVILNRSFIGSVLSASLATYLLALAVGLDVFRTAWQSQTSLL